MKWALCAAERRYLARYTRLYDSQTWIRTDDQAVFWEVHADGFAPARGHRGFGALLRRGGGTVCDRVHCTRVRRTLQCGLTLGLRRVCEKES